MHFLHTMLRVRDLDAALDFFVNKLGLRENRRAEHEQLAVPHRAPHRRQPAEAGVALLEVTGAR